MILSRIVAWLPLVAGQCPFQDQAVPAEVSYDETKSMKDADYAEALKELDIKALETDLKALMTTSQSCWPADQSGGSQNYGGLMIRLAWHCAGTFRETDGRGGCEGGRLRFPPEINWMDNANLNHALALLYDIKKKYGDGLSWGDLMTFAGTVAIRSMGGPTEKQCFGRTDETSGQKSYIFGTTAEWKKTGCEVQGACKKPLAAVTVGLIYVNPQGPLRDPTDANSGQNPDPEKSALEIREVFERMGMNDRETAALVAGGHAFGKCHTGTSGFEGPWTTTPFQWSTEFVETTLSEKWELQELNNGQVQWRTENRSSPFASTMRLTADLAFAADPTYKAILEGWVQNPSGLEDDFKKAWNKLMTQGATWVNGKKCEDGEYVAATEEPTTDGASLHLTWAAMLLAWVPVLCSW